MLLFGKTTDIISVGSRTINEEEKDRNSEERKKTDRKTMHKRAKIVIEPNVDNNVNFCFTLGKMAADMFERHIACN